MTPRYHQTGANHWHARSGYKRSPSVSGPIEPMDAEKRWPWLAYFIWVAVFACSGHWWLPLVVGGGQ